MQTTRSVDKVLRNFLLHLRVGEALFWKTTMLESMKLRYRTVPRVFFARVYQNQKQSSKRRGHPIPNYTLDELIKWLKLQPNLTTLWAGYQASGHHRNFAPSLDRLDDTKPYTLNNLQLITAHENNKKAGLHIREGKLNHGKTRARKVQQINLDGTVINVFQSSHEAGEMTGFGPGNIRSCAIGALKTAYGYRWTYLT